MSFFWGFKNNLRLIHALKGYSPLATYLKQQTKGTAMTISLVIDPIGTIRKIDLDGYEPLSNAVGGLIESVPANLAVTIWCNEEGKMLGQDFNLVATDLWEVFDEYGCVAAGDVLVGPIVIQGPADEEGECTDVPDWLLMHLGFSMQAPAPNSGKTVCVNCHGTGSLMRNGIHDGAECPKCYGWGSTYE
jgi:hypothetical protein